MRTCRVKIWKGTFLGRNNQHFFFFRSKLLTHQLRCLPSLALRCLCVRPRAVRFRHITHASLPSPLLELRPCRWTAAAAPLSPQSSRHHLRSSGFSDSLLFQLSAASSFAPRPWSAPRGRSVWPPPRAWRVEGETGSEGSGAICGLRGQPLRWRGGNAQPGCRAARRRRRGRARRRYGLISVSRLAHCRCSDAARRSLQRELREAGVIVSATFSQPTPGLLLRHTFSLFASSQ